MEELDESLETRLSVAGAASSAVQQMNDSERSAFKQSCYQQRQEALSSIAWEFRTVRETGVWFHSCRLAFVLLTLNLFAPATAFVHPATSLNEIAGPGF
jgi:hypothetical protein